MPDSAAGWPRRDGAVALLGQPVLLAWDAGGADLPLSRMFGSADGFAWRSHWLLERVPHDGVARCLQLVFVLLGLNVLVPLPLLERHSLVSCQWSLAEFGGSATPLAHATFAAWRGSGDGGPGRCFPAGHVSNAFALVGGVFALRAVSMRISRPWLLAVCVISLILGLTQLLRGAHFVSHSLWTAWICWTLSALLWHLAAAMRQRFNPEPPACELKPATGSGDLL